MGTSPTHGWKSGGVFLCLLFAGFFQWQVYDASSAVLEKQAHAREQAHASYGLLNPVTWIEQAGIYLETRVDTWQLTPEQAQYWGAEVRKEVMDPLDRFFREDVMEKGLPKLLEKGQGGSLSEDCLGRLSSSMQAAVANSYEDVIRPALGQLVEGLVVQITEGIRYLVESARDESLVEGGPEGASGDSQSPIEAG